MLALVSEWTLPMTFDPRLNFRRAADWAANYWDRAPELPVRAQTAPGSIFAALPDRPPQTSEPADAIFADLDALIMPGMTHWQHPRFFAYFPANASPPSVTAEIITAALGAQCMLWQTSPAASELEARMLDWLRQMIALPDTFTGVIQDSASTATFAAILVAREKALAMLGNSEGLAGAAPLRVYASAQVHSSVDKAVRMAGVGDANLVRIPTSGPRFAMEPGALEDAILADRAAGRISAAVVACLGGTAVGACDDIAAVADVARRHGVFVHVDAAWAGSAMICPEFRDLMRGCEGVDSFVFNPHKWLFTNFDCSAHFVRDPAALAATLGIRPSFLKTLDAKAAPGVVDYNEYSVPLGRRFRALKLWFVIRAYGVAAMQATIRDHVAWARELAELFAADKDFEVVTGPILSLFTFVYRPAGVEARDALNAELLRRINDDGRIYLTQTQHEGRFVIRFQAGQTRTTREDVLSAYATVREIASAQDASGRAA
jgi:aromatic-L-amino-acid decarboxylase